MIDEAFRLVFTKRVLDYAEGIGNVSEACRDFKVQRSTFYEWKKAFDREGIEGLVRKKPIAKSHPKHLKPEVVEKILSLRKNYNLGPQRITWYLERYHGIKISTSSVYRTLVRNGVSRLSKKVPRRAIHTRRYAKQVPGHHVQVDVKFVTLKTPDNRRVRRFQYTAVDDATRIRALKIYSRHTQKNAIDFINYVIEKFPFRIHTIRTDRGHEFQALFHWHVEDKGISMSISSLVHLSSMERSRDPTGPIRRSSISF